MDQTLQKCVPGFPNYVITVDIAGNAKCTNTNWRGTTRELKNHIDHHGYIRWCLQKNCTRVYKSAAYWVAITFLELVQNEYFDGAVIDHIDTNRLNNHPSNFRWVTPKENSNNPLSKQHMSLSRKGIIGPHKPVKQIKNGEVISQYSSAREAERKTGISNKAINHVLHGRCRSAGGFVWSY